MMKYLWLNTNGAKGTLGMPTSGDFIREYNMTVMDNPQHPSPKKAKRYRSAFTTDQVNYLEKEFKKLPYIGNARRKEVAQALNIPERAVKIWFQNRRMKEKKETTTKEFDDQVGIRKSLEFAKDQLNNASVPSVNDQKLRSLPTLTDMSQACVNNTKNTKSNNMLTRQPVQDIGIKDSGANITTAPNVITTTKVIHPPTVYVKSNHSPSDFKTSAEFSFNLCEKYKDGSINKTKHVEQTLKKEALDTIKDIKHKPLSPMEQTIPEDLSSSRKNIFPTMVQQQASSKNAANNSGYVSLVPTVSPFYTQSYMAPNGVIWKPLNVMPVVPPGSAPISVPNNSLLNMSHVQENVMRRVCNCDCHVQPQVPYNFQQQTSSPQYIITAVPVQNPSTKF